jgi:hypothetical protein
MNACWPTEALHRVDQRPHDANGAAAFCATLGMAVESAAAVPAQLTIEVSRDALLRPPMVIHHRIILRSARSGR